MDKILMVKDLCKTYIADKRQNNVLRNISFEIEKGDMVAVMGPSGSGKSTLLYTVSGMDKSTSGSIVYNGRDITEMKQDELAAVRLDEMGFIFQQMYMMKNLTILDNILLPAFESRKGKESKEQKVERAKALMKKLAISEIADNDINEVSGGQLQRACICRSMINNPGILFADEPTGALNRSTSREVMDEIVRLNDSGTTVMMVTHDAGIAAKCKRVLYLVDGTIKGEYITDNNLTQTERERSLNNWLMDLGW
ncbi:MAG: ABC transporter ATP-binding protein [Butyrivibrio crossotus]|nr:ABC transporter ATP-binding protein [Butyrivibrio crossotus]MDY4028072.1 ABC transporter ATP-binding protein [Butyrivibrio crossotus]